MSRLSELAGLVASKYDMSAREAESFFQTMIEVINDGLQSEKLVKVKGLGTFKVTTVNARESIDVNSGERITIGGREKISFTPDAAMRDLVNRPFSQFETVVVNEGVSFDEIDSKYKEDPAPVETVEPIEEEKPAPPEPIEPIKPIKPIEVEPTPPAPVEPVEEEPVSYNNIMNNVKEEIIDTTMNNIEKDEDLKFDEYGYVIEHENDPVWLNEQLQKKKKIVKWLVAALVALLLCSTVTIFLMSREIQSRGHRIESLIAQIDHGKQKSVNHAPRLTATAQAVEEDAPKSREDQIREETVRQLNEYDKMVEDNADAAREHFNRQEEAIRAVEKKATEIYDNQDKMFKKDAEKRKHEEAQRAENMRKQDAKRMAEIVKKANEAKGIDVKTANEVKGYDKYNQDPRVRLGAYVITGIATTVTVLKGQTLSSISKAHLGPGMECYVEAVNGGIKEVTAGQEVKIPALKTKKQLNKNKQ